MTFAKRKLARPAKKTVRTKKTELRRSILTTLKSQKEVHRTRKSKVIQEKLFSCLEFKNAKTILFYASFNGEVDTIPMIRKAKHIGKKIALPVIQERTRTIIPSLVTRWRGALARNSYGIPEPKKEYLHPISKKDIDLVIVPGVAFDTKGNRLGRGKGYYDAFLKSLPRHIPTISLAFHCQIVPRLPHRQGFDIPVDKVVYA
ncbi:5-formyltetrahydrofolate cyclo-ligase [Candidatus Omnitrophota bacterium]